MHPIKALLITLATPLFMGCVARVHAEPLPPPAIELTYEPLYYRGYVVYYDVGGAPYYVLSGRRHYISPGHRHYRTYVRHYRAHPRRYHQWESYRHRRAAPGRIHRPSRPSRDVRRYHRR